MKAKAEAKPEQELQYVYLVYAWKQGEVAEAEIVRMVSLVWDESLWHAQQMVQTPGGRARVEQWVLGEMGRGLPSVTAADIYWNGEQPAVYGGDGLVRVPIERPWLSSNFGRNL